MQIDKNELKACDLNGIYREIAEIFGVEMASEFYQNFSGLQLTFPTRFVSKEFVLKRLRTEYNGHNMRDLSRRYGYTERWLRELLKGLEEESNTKEE